MLVCFVLVLFLMSWSYTPGICLFNILTMLKTDAALLTCFSLCPLTKAMQCALVLTGFFQPILVYESARKTNPAKKKPKLMHLHGADRLLSAWQKLWEHQPWYNDRLEAPVAVKSAQVQQGNVISSCLRRGAYLPYLERSKQQYMPVKTLGKVSRICCGGSLWALPRSPVGAEQPTKRGV